LGTTRSRGPSRIDTDLVARVAVLEDRIDGYPPREWVKDFVKEYTEPIMKAVQKHEQTSAETAKTVQQLVEQADTLFTAHNTMLQERAQREQAEYQARMGDLKLLADNRTPLGMAKRYGPLIAIVGSCVGLLVALGKVADKLLAWMVQHYR
jgi:hypothetical protein